MSDSFIVEKLKKPGLRLVWPNHIGNSSPPEATSLGVTFRSCGGSAEILQDTIVRVVGSTSVQRLPGCCCLTWPGSLLRGCSTSQFGALIAGPVFSGER